MGRGSAWPLWLSYTIDPSNANAKFHVDSGGGNDIGACSSRSRADAVDSQSHERLECFVVHAFRSKRKEYRNGLDTEDNVSREHSSSGLEQQPDARLGWPVFGAEHVKLFVGKPESAL